MFSKGNNHYNIDDLDYFLIKNNIKYCISKIISNWYTQLGEAFVLFLDISNTFNSLCKTVNSIETTINNNLLLKIQYYNYVSCILRIYENIK